MSLCISWPVLGGFRNGSNEQVGQFLTDHLNADGSGDGKVAELDVTFVTFRTNMDFKRTASGYVAVVGNFLLFSPDDHVLTLKHISNHHNPIHIGCSPDQKLQAINDINTFRAANRELAYRMQQQPTIAPVAPQAAAYPWAPDTYAHVNPPGTFSREEMAAAIAAAVAQATRPVQPATPQPPPPTPAVVTAEELAAAVAAATAEGKRLAEVERKAMEDRKEEEEGKAKLQADNDRLTLALAATFKADTDRKAEEERLSRENEIKRLQDELAKKTQMVVRTNQIEASPISVEKLMAVVVVIAAVCIMYSSLHSQVEHKTSSLREQVDHDFKTTTQTQNYWAYETRAIAKALEEVKSQFKEFQNPTKKDEGIKVEEVPSYFWTYSLRFTLACFLGYLWYQIMAADAKKNKRVARDYDSSFYGTDEE